MALLKKASHRRLDQLLRSQPYGRTTELWRDIALEHWRLYRPKWAEAMGEERLFALAVEAARKTQDEIQELMRRGFQYHEAEEMVREKYVLVRPGADEESGMEE